MRFFEVKVKYVRPMEDGICKKVSETYVLDAESFGDAEERIGKELVGHYVEEFGLDVTGIRPMPGFLFFRNDEDGKFYHVLAFLLETDDTGKTAESPVTMLIQESDADKAMEQAHVAMSSHPMRLDYYIKAVKETKIVDVFWSAEELDRELEDFEVK